MHFVEKKLCQGESRQLLLCGAGAVVVFAMICDREVAFMHIDFDDILTLPSSQRNIRNNAHRIPDFVRDVLQQLLGVFHPDNRSVVINADDKLSAMRVGEAANPFQILVVPRLLELYCLRFPLHVKLLVTV